MNFLRRNAFIMVLLVIFGAARFAILILSQTHVHHDESLIGLMAKHISEGRSFPFYMYGQSYNAGAAWEAYCAAVPFKFFGVGVIALKSWIVVASLVCLWLFYKMAQTLNDERAAVFATLAFAVAPSLLKWHFQVRGYSFYFLSIPLLLILFWRIVTAPKTRTFFLFGLVSGLSIWSLELSFALNAALWLLLLLWRKMSIKHFAIASAGFLFGYAPAIAYNLTHQVTNWRHLWLDKIGSANLHPADLHRIFIDEMPKFFGPDTVIWYYPEKSWLGYIFYAIGTVAVVAALFPFARTPSKLRAFFSRDAERTNEIKDLAMCALAAACFIPYLIAQLPTPSYLFGDCFFLSILTGRLLAQCFASGSKIPRLAGVAILIAMLAAGGEAMVRTARRNEIETLSLCDNGNNYCMTRIPGADIAAVERHLRDHYITATWASYPLVYPLLFEIREDVIVSSAIFGWERRRYPPSIPKSEPRADVPAIFVIETDSPLRHDVEALCTRASDAPPLIAEYGTLTVIEQR